jgi:NTP pyrophosphatase (non-canonical NTP hydrolase)
MKLNDYQKAAISTAIFKEEHKYVYPALKLAGEAGEVAEKVGKVLRDKNGDFTNPDTRADLIQELGDVLWYVAALADSLGCSLEGVARINIEKLASRKNRNVIHGSGDNR